MVSIKVEKVTAFDNPEKTPIKSDD